MPEVVVSADTLPGVPVDPKLARQMRTVAAHVDKARAELDRWITERERLAVQAVAETGTSREVAELLGLSHTAVQKIVKRASK